MNRVASGDMMTVVTTLLDCGVEERLEVARKDYISGNVSGDIVRSFIHVIGCDMSDSPSFTALLDPFLSRMTSMEDKVKELKEDMDERQREEPFVTLAVEDDRRAIEDLQERVAELEEEREEYRKTLKRAREDILATIQQVNVMANLLQRIQAQSGASGQDEAERATKRPRRK